MKRRNFLSLICGVAAFSPKVVRAQPSRPRRVAFLALGQAGEPSPYLEALQGGLKDLGWVEGKNLTLHLYWASGRSDMEAVAREILKIEPDVVVTQELMAYAMRATKSQVPTVFGFSGDPVDGKLVDSFSRPGGTATGMSYLALDLVGKRIELLKEWVPQIRRIAILARPQHPGDPKEREASEAAAAKFDVEVVYFPYTSSSWLPASELTELEKVLGAIADARCDALMVFPDSAMLEINHRVARFAIEAKLPSVSGWAPFARNGLLATYGPNVREIYRSLARYVDRILRGGKPADLPVEVPSKLELVINLRTAKALGLTVPPTLLARADEVVE
jgi:putative tryptophan/tyrosine transport system substrate-binding protein